MAKGKLQTFFRIVKAERGHQFAGLYAVEKVWYRGGAYEKKEIVHEWDLRIISESILARLGGQDAYENFKDENDIGDEAIDPAAVVAEPRNPEELHLNKKNLKKELKLDSKAE